MSSVSKSSVYFVSPWVDALCVGLMSILVFVYFRFFFVSYSPYHVPPATLSFALMATWIANYPHFSASTYRLYESKERIRQHSFVSYLVPFLLLGTVALAFASPNFFAVYFVKIFTIWSPYHYSAQSAGIAILYARRSGFELNKWERFALFGFVYGAFLYRYADMETMSGSVFISAITVPLLGLPKWVPLVFEFLMVGFGVTFCVQLALKCREKKQMVPWIVLVPLVAQFIWFAWGGLLFSFQSLVPLFHSVQYLFLAWTVAVFEKRGAAADSSLQLVKKSVFWFAPNIGIGFLLFFVLPRVVSWFGGNFAFSSIVVLSAVQVHHFIVDGVIWKTRGQKNHTLTIASLFSQENTDKKSVA